MTATVPRLIEQFERGLDAPICLTWELTYACNLACVHCLSSSGKRDPRELSKAVQAAVTAAADAARWARTKLHQDMFNGYPELSQGRGQR